MSREYIIGETKGRDAVVDYNEPQADLSYEEKAKNVEWWIAKQLGEDLCRTYPNREWGIDVDTKNCMVIVKCESLSKLKGHHLHMKGNTIKELIPRVRKAAGEILERYGVTRGRILDPATLETFERDVRDDAIASDARV